MAAKKTSAKAKPKRGATKANGKPKAAAKAKPTAKAKAKVAKPAPRAKAKAAAKPAKPPAKKPAKKPAAAVTAPILPPSPQQELFPFEPDVVEGEAAPKKGPFARLAGGVGSLIARMRKKAPETPSPNATIELATGDILMETPEPPPVPKPKR